MEYKDSQKEILQNLDLGLIGMRYGYKAICQYNIKNLQFLVEADYNVESLSGTNNSRVSNKTTVDYSQKVFDLYASIKYIF